jgi:hypothetical protein
MRSLALTWASQARTAIALPVDVVDADAPALKKMRARCTRQSHAGVVRGAAAHPDFALLTAIVSARTCAAMRAVDSDRERRITLSPYAVALDSSPARALSWRAKSAGTACGADVPGWRWRGVERDAMAEGRSARRAAGRKEVRREAAESVLRARVAAWIRRPRPRSMVRVAPPAYRASPRV